MVSLLQHKVHLNTGWTVGTKLRLEKKTDCLKTTCQGLFTQLSITVNRRAWFVPPHPHSEEDNKQENVSLKHVATSHMPHLYRVCVAHDVV